VSVVSLSSRTAAVILSALALSGTAGAANATVLPPTAGGSAVTSISHAGALSAEVASGADAPAASAPPSRPFAAPQAVSTPNAPTAGGLAQVTFALLLVLIAIFAVAWLAKRMRGFNNRVGDAIDILADVSLGQKERAVLLKVGEKQILVGVAPGRVNTLHVLEHPVDLKKPPADTPDARPNFKQLMLRSLGK